MRLETPARTFTDAQTPKETQMHYRNGREAKNGDRIVQLSTEGGKVLGIGILHDATPGNDYCNGAMAPIPASTGVCMVDAIHADDLAAILAEKGLDKRPAGK